MSERVVCLGFFLFSFLFFVCATCVKYVIVCSVCTCVTGRVLATHFSLVFPVAPARSGQAVPFIGAPLARILLWRRELGSPCLSGVRPDRIQFWSGSKSELDAVMVKVLAKLHHCSVCGVIVKSGMDSDLV